MSTDRAGEIRRRAAVHAALSDPARLAIVDLLTLGDASPSELSAALDLPSNLLAHHVNLLLVEGLVTKSRSEGDGRRTYLHLVPGAFDNLLPGGARTAARVLFVCTANSARSVLAASLWRRASTVPVDSAGTHPAARIHPGAAAAAARHHLPLARRRPRHLDQVHTAGDLVVTVCDRAHEDLGPVSDLHWSIPDPVGAGTVAAFDGALDELARRVDDLAPHITPA